MSSCCNKLLLRPTKIEMTMCMAHSRADAAGTCSGSFTLEQGALLRSDWKPKTICFTGCRADVHRNCLHIYQLLQLEAQRAAAHSMGTWASREGLR